MKRRGSPDVAKGANKPKSNIQDKSKGPTQPDLPAPTNPQKKTSPQVEIRRRARVLLGVAEPETPHQQVLQNYVAIFAQAIATNLQDSAAKCHKYACKDHSTRDVCLSM
ncbi:unnamed protein product [Acanthoscelides obtectus]|uniref:Uncharacterized protein n=1 Tax=Acanthoscelides obtectus TaxID=200917 RepID=A0A9P0PR89_ACAOB|nr:unnamed protein product [Acanthoscelides obtectus]CAK1681977.1 hypothetical protein AOBTE_LOCUS33361 [Acanthoscelides obtectus]